MKERGCTGENFGDIPIPFVRMPPDYKPGADDLAIYGEPGRDELEWFSAKGRFPGGSFSVLAGGAQFRNA